MTLRLRKFVSAAFASLSLLLQFYEVFEYWDSLQWIGSGRDRTESAQNDQYSTGRRCVRGACCAKNEKIWKCVDFLVWWTKLTKTKKCLATYTYGCLTIVITRLISFPHLTLSLTAMTVLTSRFNFSKPTVNAGCNLQGLWCFYHIRKDMSEKMESVPL